MDAVTRKSALTIAKICFTTIETASSTIDGRATQPASWVAGSEEGSDGWLDILTIALGQAADGKWYVSTLNLQLVSFKVCVACRGVRTLRVNVVKDMALSLWGDEFALGDSVDTPQIRRVPAVRAAGVAWMIPSGMLLPLLSQAPLLKDAEWMHLTGVDCGMLDSLPAVASGWNQLSQSVMRMVCSPRRYFEAERTVLHRADQMFSSRRSVADGAGREIAAMQNMGNVSWPSALRELSIGCLSDERVDLAALPSSLERLVLSTNQPIDSVALPIALRRLALGRWFNEPVANVVWPKHLNGLTFGPMFNQPISGVVWPESLLQLTLGNAFNQPIIGVVWPPSLLHLAFWVEFNQPIIGVVWPASLLHLTFGDRFNQQIMGVVWPASLLQLILGDGFDQPITNVAWPACLRQLTLGDRFNQPIIDVTWPTCLPLLALGKRFNQPIAGVVWPASLLELAFGESFNQPLMGVLWPASLNKLQFGESFNHPIIGVIWPVSLNKMQFGDRFNHPIAEAVWPSCLESLEFGRDFDQTLEGMKLPASLHCLMFHINFVDKEEELDWPPSLFPKFKDTSYERGDESDPLTVVATFDKPTTILLEELRVYTWPDFSIED